MIITIDGPAGSGKSTVARLLAERLGVAFLDTGAMYRTVTVAAMRAGVDLCDEAAVLKLMDETNFGFTFEDGKMCVAVEGVDVTEDIRSPEITAKVKHIASAGRLRGRLVEMQRELAKQHGRIVTEGRDQGTVAFPGAKVKFFLTADVKERARRRHAELVAKGIAENIEDVLAAIEKRDLSDRSRSVGPLKPADDAIIVETTDLTIEEVVEKLVCIVREKCSETK